MECNKEEAVRARCIAEKKMQSRDFVGARKFALKAQQLFPDLENMSQILTVCEVHCAAETKVNGFEDWYGILQVGSTADESLIKKQYRKLALLLHPDKNKFAGAEAAFKLVGEAHRTLSDQATRSVYDMKRNAIIPAVGRRPPPHQPNMTSNSRKQSTAPNIYQNNATTPLTQQQTQTAHANQTFWTACPSCGTKYQYYRSIIKKALRCQKCLNPFIAYDLNAQGVSPDFNSDHSWNQPGIRQCKDFQGHWVKGTSQQANSRVDPCMDTQGNPGVRPTAPEVETRVGSKYVFGEGSGNKVKENSQAGSGLGKEQEVNFGKVNFEKVNKREPVVQSSRNPSGKRRKKMVVESSDTDGTDSEEIIIEEYEHEESSDTDSTDSEEIIIEDSEHAAAGDAEMTGYSPRRSTRQKHNISYNEDSGSDHDFENFTNSKQFRRELHNDDRSSKELSEDDADEVEVPTNATTVSKSKLNDRKRGSLSADEDKPNGNKLRNECMEGSEDLKVKGGSIQSSKDGVSPISDSGTNGLNSGTLAYPDPEFHDYDQERVQACFAVDQIWALYDDLDGMPRFYARIRSVSSARFKLRFTWLEYDPVGQAEKDWSDKELPVSCGNFIHGKTESTEDILLFSHIVPASKDSKRNSYVIYPRKGEVWALYKGWNIKWSSNRDQHREYKYEFVEILSDFACDSGVNITPLTKLKGFVSLFCQGGREGACILHIPPNELLRFSHMVPSYRMTGKEREAILEGFYELDPASLPGNFEKTFDSVTLDEVRAKAKHRGHANVTKCLNSRTVERKSRNDLENDLKNMDEETEKIGVEEPLESSGIPAEGLNVTNERKHGQTSGSHFSAMEAEKNIGRSGPSERLVNGEESHLDRPSNCSDNVTENGNDSMSEPSCPIVSEYPFSEFYDFCSGRSTGKFKAGQIWALYCEDDGFPKYYAVIRRVIAADFRVHLTWLEACPLSEEEVKWSNNNLPIACGRFRPCSGRGANEEYDTTDTFSHLVQAERVQKRRFNIHPRVDEVWALYKNWNVEWKISDLKNCLEKGEYEVVEVLSSSASMLRVMILEKVDGFRTVFKPRRNNRVPTRMEIPSSEFLRFSHRIPSFRLTEERGGELRGYWELDAASLPDILVCTNFD